MLKTIPQLYSVSSFKTRLVKRTNIIFFRSLIFFSPSILLNLIPQCRNYPVPELRILFRLVRLVLYLRILKLGILYCGILKQISCFKQFCTFLNLFTSMLVCGALFIFVYDVTTYDIINFKKEER